MTAHAGPPFRAEHVGRLLKSRRLKDAFDALAGDCIREAALARHGGVIATGVYTLAIEQ